MGTITIQGKASTKQLAEIRKLAKELGATVIVK